MILILDECHLNLRIEVLKVLKDCSGESDVSVPRT